MIVIIGFHTITKLLWQGYITCRRCLQRQPHDLTMRTDWGTFFFIPLIPLKRERILTCHYCGLATPLNKYQTDQFLADTTNQAAKY
jgi:hypothetical protein